jgi:kumamolisin
MTNSSRTPIPGSEREPLADVRQVGAVDPDRIASVTLTLKRRGPDPDPGQVVSHEDFAAKFGADPEAIERVEDFASAHGLDVVEADPARRMVVVQGRLADLATAFDTDLQLYEHPDLGLFRGRVGAVSVPSNVADSVESVLGLDDRPTAEPRMVLAKPEAAAAAADPAAPPANFSGADLAKLYGFPAGTTGKGQTIAIIELGGGYKPADLAAYWTQEGISPAPSVVAVSVGGATNSPVGSPSSADGEVLLDIDVIGTAAPGARMAVYFAHNTTAGFLKAITQAAHDKVRNPSVISISWGMAEDAPGGWTAQARTAYNQALKDAGALGVTVTVAAGDDGSRDNVNDGKAHVDFPSASPYALACGGTKLKSKGTTIASEVVWNEPTGGATGGGVSRFFALPGYQTGAGVPPQHDTKKPGRGVPDVSGDADPFTGYRVRVDGQNLVFGGTSAVAPLWAALIARVNEKLHKRVGFVHPKLYKHGVQRDITSGNNGAYHAGPGWDACTGLGSPDGAKVVAALQ